MALGSLRDLELLDKLDSLDPSDYAGSVWRVTRERRDPCEGSSAGGRWSDKTFDVLYTGTTADAAIAEMHFHLAKGQPVVPSKPTYLLHELSIESGNLLNLSDPDLLDSLGVNMSRYGKLGYLGRSEEYQRSQEIGEAVNFLGADGVIVPNARLDSSLNIVVFCNQLTLHKMNDAQLGRKIDFNVWKKTIDNKK